LDCPLCKEAMITFEVSEVEIDYCVKCRGIWLDEGELELLTSDCHKTQHLLNSFKTVESIEKVKKCPICFRKMEKILYSNSTQELLIDKCPQNHGIWFDKDELEDTLAMLDLQGFVEIKEILYNMFKYDPRGETDKNGY
jgi:Zn-finger nucleic acid-binding protein